MHTTYVTALITALSAGLLGTSTAMAVQTPNNSTNGLQPVGEKMGVNCQGSYGCDHFDASGKNNGKTAVIDYIVSAIDNIDQNRIYHNGERIACQPGSYHYNIGLHTGEITGGICAFLQKAHRLINGHEIQDHAHGLKNHGCRACGSQPTENDNNVANGMLTFNVVADVALHCDGLC
ncbi:hypothetical protein LTR86_010911 [Recurvomyces mirabilis]|nr:hypothetical protein LTR86_010911 [Recurvomyces mirabilis]